MFQYRKEKQDQAATSLPTCAMFFRGRGEQGLHLEKVLVGRGARRWSGTHLQRGSTELNVFMLMILAILGQPPLFFQPHNLI